MSDSLLSRWRDRAAKPKVNPADPARIDEQDLARGADVEEYNVGDPQAAMGVALKNLQQDPHHYDASVRELWLMRTGNADWIAIAVPKVFASYKRDIAMGLSPESAIGHCMTNWQMVINMRRQVNGETPVTPEEIAQVQQGLEQLIASEGGQQKTAMVRTAKDAPRDYSCVMADVADAGVKKAFHEIVAMVDDADVYDPPGEDKYGREDRPHVTVKYGLHTGEADDVRPLVQGFGPIEAEIDGVSFFRKEGKDYDVLKFDIKSDDLHRLRKIVEDALPATDEHPDYHPHMTICYLKRGAAEKYADDKVFAEKAKAALQGTGLIFDTVCFSDKESAKTNISCTKTASATWRMHFAKAKKNPAYEKETALIRENKKKPEASKAHEFDRAKWTHPNGHPRCLVCGDEEPIGGRCNVEPTAKDYADFQAELDIEFPEQAARREKEAQALGDKFERGEITYTEFRRRSAMSDEAATLLTAYWSGRITQTDLDQGLRRLRGAA